jgi:transcriptional regulator with XRE-family HTH domain
VDLAAAGECFGLSGKTVRRYLAQGLSLGFFASVKVQAGEAVIYYNSLPRVCLALGLYDFGVGAKVEVGEIRFNRVLATELVAQKLQRQSKYKAGQESGVKPIAEEKIFESSDASNGGKFKGFFRTDRFIGVSSNFATYGASQQTIAERSGKSPETVKRRLSAKYRDRNSLERINRIQPIRHIPFDQVQEEPLKQSLFERLLKDSEATDRTVFFTNTANGRMGKGFMLHGQFFKYEPNVYELTHNLTSCRAARSRFKVFVAKNQSKVGPFMVNTDLNSRKTQSA